MEDNPYSVFLDTVKGISGAQTISPFFTAKITNIAPFIISINGALVVANRVNRRLLYEIEKDDDEQVKAGDTVLVAQVNSQTHIVLCKVV